MALNLRDITFVGPAMPEPFVRYTLEPLLAKKQLLGKENQTGAAELHERWEVYHRKLRAMREEGGDHRVKNHVIEPLVERLGYESLLEADKVTTREGAE